MSGSKSTVGPVRPVPPKSPRVRLALVGCLATLMVALPACSSNAQMPRQSLTQQIGAFLASSSWTAGAKAQPQSLPIGACINLNHFAPSLGGESPGKRLDAGDMANIRAAGFKTIRLQVNWRSQSDPSSPHTIDPKWLARVSDMVDAAQAEGLTVILVNQNFFLHDPAAGSKASKDWMTAVWRQLARHFANKDTAHLWFELNNEPNLPFTNANLMDSLGPSLAEVRKVSRDRPVIIGGERSSRVESLETLSLPDDPNVWPTFHYYEPYFFTHQGATWGKGKMPPLGRAYGVLSEAERRARMPGDADRLAADVEKVRAYIRRTGKIPFLGETGAYDTAPLPQRVAYVRNMHRAFEPLGVPQCYYSYTNNFEFFSHKTNTWLPGMLEAIGLHDPGPLKTANQ
jgi:endoglucanase